LLGLVVFATLVATGSIITHRSLFGPDPTAYPAHLGALLSLPFDGLLVRGTWATLRYEGLSVDDVGLGSATLVAGVAAFGLVWAWVTAVGVAYLLATGATGRLGLAFDLSWYWVATWFLLTVTLSNGLSEEFLFRGYVQSKCTALGRSLPGIPPAVTGIVAAGLLFGVPHVPLGVIGYGAGPRAIPSILLQNLLPAGVVYGTIYYLTQNVWFTGFVHGFANATVLPSAPAAVPLLVPFASGSALLVAVGYQ
jgi:membrane protease YdiL (CAAX protease family)